MYPIITIPEDANESPEQLGSKYKFWYANQTQMFKQGRVGTGEDWAEKIACELCLALGLPHAHYEFAKWRDLKGTVTENFVHPSGRLVLGNELLAGSVPNYPGARKYKLRQHTVRLVSTIMTDQNLKVPLGVPTGSPLTASNDYFAGYLLLDAWIGNTDRHHENWGVIISSSNDVSLAPTFDHAASLGRELTDAVRTERLNTRDQGRNVSAYVAKARSALYRSTSNQQPLSTIDAFKEFAKRSPLGKKYWLERLKRLSEDQIDKIFDELPPEIVSAPARQFARAILRQNKDTLIACAEDNENE